MVFEFYEYARHCAKLSASRIYSCRTVAYRFWKTHNKVYGKFQVGNKEHAKEK
jgi:hypothetical protein